jgi:hypothetical protein
LRALEDELNVQGPVGFWDPVCFTSDGNVEDFKRRPQTEFKYSRDAMLATVGYISLGITAGLWLPASVYQYQILGRAERLRSNFKGPSSGWAQILAYGAFRELLLDQSSGIAARTSGFGLKVPTLKHPAGKQAEIGG